MDETSKSPADRKLGAFETPRGLGAVIESLLQAVVVIWWVDPPTVQLAGWIGRRFAASVPAAAVAKAADAVQAGAQNTVAKGIKA